jgi:predicted enzyme related to lactoylglutathione lyase
VIRHITFDCTDPLRLAEFWGALLGWEHDVDGGEALVFDRTQPRPWLLFIKVPEAKAVKNRVHLDIQPALPRDRELERVLALGATIVEDHRRDDGTGWITVADPEGNELCIERNAAERGLRRFPPVRDGDERSMLLAMLDWYREGVLRKVEWLDPRHTGARPLRSTMTIGGLVKHLALVEDGWFTEHFADRPQPEPWASAPWDDDGDWEITTGAADPLETSVALYRAAIERSRAVCAGRSLDDPAAGPAHGREFNLRFAIVHLLEETARHLGHLDLLREQLDGTTGE